MKRLLLFFSVISTLCQNALAYDFKVGDLYYNIISNSDLTVEVTSHYAEWHTGSLYYYYDGDAWRSSDYFRSGFYNYFDDKGLIYQSSWGGGNVYDSRTNRFESGNQNITTRIPCTDPYGDITIPETVEYLGVTFNVVRIGEHAFYGCRYLTSINIPSTVSSIGDSAFSGCTRLSTISLNNISTISKKCFAGCSLLSSVNISASINTIEDSAFVGCTHITSFQLNNTIPPIVGTNAINSIPAYASIYVPCASISAYQQSPSWNFFSHFYGVGAAGNLNLSINDTLRGNITIIDTADCDNPATIFANANYGYHFVSWNDGITANPRTITIEYDTSFTAIFDKNKYYVSGSSTNTVMGNIVGSDSVLYLDTVTLVPVANYGYRFSHWNDGNTDNPRKVIVNRDSIFTAYFDSSLFVLQTLSNNEQMGYARISSSDYLASAVGNFKYLSTQTIYATSTDGNQFMQWSDGVLSNPRSVTIYGDTSFTAVFAPKYVLTVQSANDSMGTVTGGGLFNNQAQTVITAQANYGYHFTSWNDGVTTSTRTITVTSDTSFTANFARNQYSITATSANQSWGGVTGSTNALYGDSVTLTATAIGQHHFSYWSDGTNQYTDNPLHVRVTKNDYYTAFFEMNQYQVSVFTDGGGNGYVGLESTNNTGNYDYMTQVTIRAVPYSGNRFAGWSDGIVYNPRALTITKDTSFTALFAADIYTITVNSDNDVMGSVTGGGIYQADSIAEIAAVPNHGYKFDHWQDNVTINPRNVTVITNQTYTAYFVTYDTLRIHDTSYVDVFVHDTTVVVDSVWVYDTTIVTYTDTVTNTVFDTITTTVFDTIVNTIYDTTVVYSTDTLWLTLHDTIYLPQYIHDTIYLHDTIYVGVDEVETINVKIYTSNGQIVVDGSDGNQVWLYDINGRLIATRKDNHSPLRFDIPSSGAYLVKIGNYHSRKVVVIK